MFVGSSNVMLGSLFSFIFSSSRVTKVGELINKLEKESIKSCLIGISSLKFHNISKNIVHAALLLSDKKLNELVKEKKTKGILIEYGNYPPDEENAKKEEKDYIKNGHVIYRYGEREGGIRYYTNTSEEFIKKFCDVGYISLNIEKENQATFSFLIEEIAPISEKKWIKKNYMSVNLIGSAFNSQTFICHCLDILKPVYHIFSVTKGKSSISISDDKKESIIPAYILNTLRKYKDE